jgi:hypothetical protein
MSTITARHPPLIVICNYLELFSGFLDKLGDSQLIQSRMYADRDLFWLDDPKLVITSTPMDAAGVLLRRWGYPGTRTVTPRVISAQLCLDILRDEQVMAQICAYAGEGRTLRLVPYTTTAEFLTLVEALRHQYGLEVQLPESPLPENLWVRNYVDSKIGFRMLVKDWLKDRVNLPEGYVSNSRDEAVEIAWWFIRQGRDCVLKYDRGGGGVGNCFLFAEDCASPEAIRACLKDYGSLFDQAAIVEEFIHPHQQLSPSLELFVPAPGEGQPRITYLCNQVFEKSGIFSGILIHQDLARSRWYPELAEAGLCIANHLQQLGYVGFFDLDTILDQDEKLYLLEVNSRRTGGTFADEFCRRMIGADYQERVILFSSNYIQAGRVDSIADLTDCLADLLYPIGGDSYGIVITSISSLPGGKFGALFIAPTNDQLLYLWNEMHKRLTGELLAVEWRLTLCPAVEQTCG